MDLIQKDLERAASILAKSGITNAQDRFAIMREASELIKHIRTLEGRIKNPELWQTVHTRANEIDLALARFSK